MGRRRKSPNSKNNENSTPNGETYQNGHATGIMEGSLVEHRKRHPVLESPDGESYAAHLMSRGSFSLDEPPPALSQLLSDHGKSSRGFTQLPERDRRNFLLLVLLYFLQGVPMGLAGGSVPFLLKQHVSYAQMGVFSLASYPYSLKLLWSPIVDALWHPKVGRRKSWILPIQTLSGFGMLWLSGRAQQMMNNAGGNDGANVWGFTWWWFMLVFMCATQDIAVDGWALTLLSPENLSYASTAQTVGLTAGQFLSSTVFLAFNSEDFANKWFRAVPGDTGLVTLGGALATAGWIYLVVTVGLALWKREELTKNDEGVWDVYKVMLGILKLKNIQTLLVVHLIAKIGFQANDAVTGLKLLDKGFGQDNMALTVLIDFPFEIGLGYYVGKWSSTYPPMQLWCWAFVGRLAAAVTAQLVVLSFPAGGVTISYLCLAIFGHVFSTFMNTVMFVAVSAFHAKIADPVYGGTYMTLLAT
jgi:PAT family acetyl-CoA transporter-like MFS transporter 1